MYSLDKISDKEADKLSRRLLKMVADNDKMFELISDQIISDLAQYDYIEIDLENETIEGTTLTLKGYRFLTSE